MKTILIANQKGGVGKTWIADEICYMCERYNLPYSLIDYDGQGGLAHEPHMTENAEITVIDTPGALQERMVDWISKADLIIVPTTMTAKEQQPLQRMLQILEPWTKKGKQVLVVLNKWNRFIATADFEEWFFALYPNQITVTLSECEVVRQAVNYKLSVTTYRKNSKSAMEILAMFDLISEMLYGNDLIIDMGEGEI